jgi:hypothetical protein
MPRASRHSLVTEVGSNYTPWEHSEAYADDSGAESDALTPENTTSRRKSLKALAHSVVRLVNSPSL